jgi:hypothetical protein
MFPSIVATRNVTKRGICVLRSRLSQHFADRIILRQRRGDATHAPGSAQVEAIEMHNLWITAVRDRGRHKKRLGLALRKIRQKPLQPCVELTRWQYTLHQICFHQTGRKETCPIRLPCGRNSRVLAEVRSATLVLREADLGSEK